MTLGTVRATLHQKPHGRDKKWDFMVLVRWYDGTVNCVHQRTLRFVRSIEDDYSMQE